MSARAGIDARSSSCWRASVARFSCARVRTVAADMRGGSVASLRGRAEQLEHVVVHDPLHRLLVETGELLGEVERLRGALAVRPVGSEQDALHAEEFGQ